MHTNRVSQSPWSIGLGPGGRVFPPQPPEWLDSDLGARLDSRGYRGVPEKTHRGTSQLWTLACRTSEHAHASCLCQGQALYPNHVGAPNQSANLSWTFQTVLVIRFSRELDRLIFTTDFRDRQAPTDFLSQLVGDLGVTRHSLNRSSRWVHPERMRSPFSLELTAVSPQMAM